MPSRAAPFCPDAAELIVTYLRSGAYEHIAAEAAGVPFEVYQAWLARGEGKRAREPYASFARRARQAKAHARVWAEIQLRQKDVRTWLKSGPGREAPGEPGWSREVSASPKERRTDVFASPEWQRLWGLVLQALAAFPEARQAVAQALLQEEGKGSSEAT